MNEIYSVVIPAYNSEKSIEACLASVAAQTFAPLEVLVVDDHSHDGTEIAIQRCSSQFTAAGITLLYYRLEKNAGPSVARNFGINLAKGSYIAFLDADDTWHKDKLAIIDHYARTMPGLMCHSYTEDTESNLSKCAGEYEVQYLSIFQMLLSNPAQTSCAVIRKQYALAFNEAMRHCEDYDLWLRIVENSVVLRLVGSPLTKLGRPQLTVGGLSGNTARMRTGEIRVYFNFCRRAWSSRVWFLPGLLTFSLLKHIYSRFRRRNL